MWRVLALVGLHYVGACNGLPTPWLNLVCVVSAWGWIIVIFFFKRVQKEEDKAAGWHHVFGEKGRAEMCKISHETHKFPQSLSYTTEAGMRLYPNT